MLLLLAGLGAAERAFAQTNSQPIRRVLSTASKNVLLYQKNIPSISCQEHIVARQIVHNKVRSQTISDSVIRVVRDGSPVHPLSEVREYFSIDGKPAAPGIEISFPVLVSGAFSEGIWGFVSPAALACLDYSFDPNSTANRGAILFKSDKDKAALPECARFVGTTGKLTLNNYGRIIGVERTVPPEVAKRLGYAYNAAITFASVTLGNNDYQLPVHTYARDVTGQFEFTADYSSCKLFTSTVTLEMANQSLISLAGTGN